MIIINARTVSITTVVIMEDVGSVFSSSIDHKNEFFICGW